VQRIDPARNRVVKTLRFPGQKPSGIAASAGAIWVGADYGSEVRRLDPRSCRWSKVRTGQLGSSWLAAAAPSSGSRTL
jgi:streptogramin lyase